MQPHIIILSLVGLAFIPEVIWIIQLFRDKAQSVHLPRITLRINIVVFVLGTALLLLALTYDVNIFRYKAPMQYSAWKEISWADFRAIKRPHQTLQGSQNFAFICSSIDVDVHDCEAEVVALFHPARSYTFSEETADDALLTHELYHLHITEYWARRIRKEFSELGQRAHQTEFVETYKGQEREMQYTYDEETDHGYVRGKQLSWQKKIDSCLSSLNNFAQTKIPLN
jgi:hypothetical protein